MRRPIALFVALVGLCFMSGCGYGRFQTAKTVPKGEYRVTMAQQFQGNEDLGERGVIPQNFPPELMVRVGVHERVDVGASVMLMGGLLLDTKFNLFPKLDRLDFSLSGGFGAAADWGALDDILAVLHLPLTASLSYRIGRRTTPYVAAGYSFFWIFGRDKLEIPPPVDPNTEYAARKGYGDGIVRLTAGIELKLNARFGILVEYSYWLPVVDDPGDYFTFVPNHMGGVGVVF